MTNISKDIWKEILDVLKKHKIHFTSHCELRDIQGDPDITVVNKYITISLVIPDYYEDIFKRYGMIKDIIKYNDKEYQLSTVNIDGCFETMIFPIKDGVISGKEVYMARLYHARQSCDLHGDIYYHPEKYLSDKAIEKYLACKNCHEWCCTMCKYFK